MLAADYIVGELVSGGIDTFFVLTGGAIAPLIDAISRNHNAQVYCFQHEQAASMAADGYYRATSRAACVAVTSGPGVQNIVNGLCGCFYDSVPALFISGQVNMKESLDSITSKPRQVGFQETPIVDCIRPFTKYVQKIVDVCDVAHQLASAVRAMNHGRRGPSLLDIPVNVQMTEMPLQVDPPQLEFAAAPLTRPVPVDFAVIADAIQRAQRPVFIVGDGARPAQRVLANLLKGMGVPVSVSWGGLDVLPYTKNHLGRHGVYGDRVANFAIQNADLLVILGSRLDTRQTGGQIAQFSTCSTKVMVDIDANEIEKLCERGMNIQFKCVMDVDYFVANLHPFLDCPVQCAAWLGTLRTWQQKYSCEPHESYQGYANPYEVLSRVNRLLPSDAIVAVDTGATLVWAYQTLRTTHFSQRIFSNLGNSSMGYALPAAIGAALGCPNRLVICIVGDGGFQQNIQELVTARHYNCNIKVFVFNNKGYGIIKQFQNAYLHGRHVATACNDIYGSNGAVNFVNVANAFGVSASKIDDSNIQDFDIASPGFHLYEVVLNENQGIQPKTDFGNSLENMSPKIDSRHDMILAPPPHREAGGWVKL